MSRIPSEIIVAAVSRENVIGRDGRMPWHDPEELRHFRAVTLDCTVIMGRRTYAAIGRPLPQRRNIVISQTLPAAPGIFVCPDFDAAVALAQSFAAPIRYIGGAMVYAAALKRADGIILSRLHLSVAGDTYFPAIDPHIWQATGCEDHPTFSLCTYVRRGV